MNFQWDDLVYWQSGEWQVIQENLDDLKKKKIKFNPERQRMFNALDATPFDKVRVCIVGQDPYPESKYATGLAFSIPKKEKQFPITLANIFKEYCSDLHLPQPSSGDLTPWAEEGVLLWNAIPTCEEGKSMSHAEWGEWEWLTKEIMERLSKKCVVFLLLGGVARKFAQYIDTDTGEIIETSHPSPRGVKMGKVPFLGSRAFSTINDKLVAQGLEPINWRLP